VVTAPKAGALRASAKLRARGTVSPELMVVRDFIPGDEPALHAVFHSAIHILAAREYTPAQRAAWAPARPDMDRWGMRVRLLRPFVVEEDANILGYADLQENGYIDHFYVSGTSGRRGVGRLLMERIHARAEEWQLSHLFSDVSRTAQPFFTRFGFLVVEHKTVVIRGVSLANARMEKRFGPGGYGTG